MRSWWPQGTPTSSSRYVIPGVFRVMFRPDVCDPERFPEVVQAGQRARRELARLAKAVMGDGAQVEAEVLICLACTAWPHCSSTAP